MTMKTYTKVLFLLLSFAAASHFTYQFYTKKKKRNVKKEIHEVIMFSHGNTALKRSKYSRCAITASMDRLFYYLNLPRQTLDICMYVFTNMDLASIVLKLHYKGVKVRIIVDADMAFSTGSSIRKLEKQGIPVRWMKSTNFMHHKFCIVDGLAGDVSTPFVIMGSLNWTNQALNGNWEDIVVTSQSEIVRQYQEEYEKLWVKFTPVVDLI